MLTSLLDFSKSIDIPQTFINNFIEHKQDSDYMPISSITYTQHRENSPSLIQILCNEMKLCPFQNIRLVFEEWVAYSGMKREITLIGRVDKSKEKELEKFKDDFSYALSRTDEFACIDLDSPWKVYKGKTIGDKFISPTVYDINANPTQLNVPNKNKMTLIVLWKDQDSFTDVFNSLANKIKVSQLNDINIISVSLIESNFFKRKEFLINTTSRTIPNMVHYFEGEASKAFFNYNDFSSWIIVLDKEGVIKYDSQWEGQDCMKLINLISQNEKVIECNEENEEYLNANDHWWSVCNKNKTEYIEIVYDELTDREMNDINFTMYAQMIINKDGVTSRLIKPQLFGSIDNDFKDLLKEFIEEFEQKGKLDKIAVDVVYEPNSGIGK